MGCLPPFSTGAGFRWPIHSMSGFVYMEHHGTHHTPELMAMIGRKNDDKPGDEKGFLPHFGTQLISC